MLTGRRDSEKPGGSQKEIFLVTGAGQVDSELITHLRKTYGDQDVVSTDVGSATSRMMKEGPFHNLGVAQQDQLARLVIGEGVDTVVHLRGRAALDLEMDMALGPTLTHLRWAVG
jgi:UDP-glucose 4-epimerase